MTRMSIFLGMSCALAFACAKKEDDKDKPRRDDNTGIALYDYADHPLSGKINDSEWYYGSGVVEFGRTHDFREIYKVTLTSDRLADSCDPWSQGLSNGASRISFELELQLGEYPFGDFRDESNDKPREEKLTFSYMDKALGERMHQTTKVGNFEITSHDSRLLKGKLYAKIDDTFKISGYYGS